jgi:diguanylate cyclase (GGDEF)-like protein
MELLLWRWSTAVQATSLVMITVFFVLLTRAVRLAAVRWWLRAWGCNLAALGVTVFFWYVQAGTGMFPLVASAYIGAKTAFVLFLIHGGWTLKRPGDWLVRPRIGALALVLFAAAGGLVGTTIDRLGLVQHSVMGVLLVAGALRLLDKPRQPGLRWLAAGLIVRGALSLCEAAAYGLQLVSLATPSVAAGVRSFLAASSSFDSGAEWLLALGCVLALSERVQDELRQSNAGLLAAQEDLRRLADRDPLTALANRRQLPEAFRAVQPQGALVLFFDLDGFKQINDRYGHLAGDECLRRFATALRECFRPNDVLVRYGGDEFLVVASGLDEEGGWERVARLRDRLRFPAESGPAITFSVGAAPLAPGGYPDAAVKLADESMYAAKAGRRQRPIAAVRKLGGN